MIFFVYKIKTRMDIKNIDLSKINHILNCMNLSDVQDVESRIFTESLVRLKDEMIIKQNVKIQ